MTISSINHWSKQTELNINNETPCSWWRRQMEIFSALMALCAGNSPVTGELPAQKSVTRSFGIFFDLCLNKQFSKQSCGWWFETPTCSWWRHCNVKVHGKSDITSFPCCGYSETFQTWRQWAMNILMLMGVLFTSLTGGYHDFIDHIIWNMILYSTGVMVSLNYHICVCFLGCACNSCEMHINRFNQWVNAKNP